jgi:hypothetical protein
MTPQILGNLTSVAQKTAQANQNALQAQQMAVNAQNTASAATSAVTALQSTVGALSTGPTLLATPVTFTKGDLIFDGSWHILTVSGVPSSAQFMFVGGYVTNQGATGGGYDNARQKFFLSPDNGTSQYLASYTNGVAGQYENDAAIGPALVPCSGSTIYYKWVTGVTDTNFVIYGYA